VLFTSVSGATIALIGALSLLMQVDGVHQSISRTFGANALILPLLMIVPAIIGLIMQHASPDKSAAPAGGAKPAVKHA
jgi:hypothetical protein